MKYAKSVKLHVAEWGSNFTKKEMLQVLKAGHKNYFFNVKYGIYELKSKRAVCPYLKKDNSCEIHEVKPVLCLCWPVFPNFDRRKGGYIIIQCPLVNCLSKKETEKCRKEASKVSERLLDVALDNTTVSKSTRRLIETRVKKFKKKRLR